MVKFLPALLLGASMMATSSFAFSSKTTSWPEYKNSFIDPAIAEKTPNEPLEGHMDPYTRKVADKFWLAKFWTEKEKLHQMNEVARHDEEETSFSAHSSRPERVTSFASYRHNLQAISSRYDKQGNTLKGHIDPEKRAEADEYWLQTFLEEKAKLHGRNEQPTP